MLVERGCHFLDHHVYTTLQPEQSAANGRFIAPRVHAGNQLIYVVVT